MARTVLLAEDDDEGGLLGLTCATRAGLSSGLRRLPLRAGQARPGAKAGTLQAACDRRTASYSVRRVGRSKGLSAGELTGMYCTAAWPVPLSSHWPSSLRQYTLARWRASAPLSPMLAHPALGPGARAAACCSAEPQPPPRHATPLRSPKPKSATVTAPSSRFSLSKPAPDKSPVTGVTGRAVI